MVFTNTLMDPKVRQKFADVTGDGIDSINPMSIDLHLHRKFQEQMSSYQRNGYDFAVTASLWFQGNFVYLIPHAGDAIWKVWNFLTEDPTTWGCQEYGYWNNTDRPEEVSAQEWGRRRTAWNKILDHHWNDKLVMEILTPDTWSSISPVWELVDATNKTKGKKRVEA